MSEFISAIISATVGAFSASAFNYFHWKMVEKKHKESEYLAILSKVIAELEDLSLEYWIKDANDEDSKNEAYLKSKLWFLQKYTRLKKDKELNDFVSEMYDLITGGDFETKNRKASNAKAIKISKKFSDIKVYVYRLSV